MSISLATAIESTSVPDFFEMAIRSRDMEILLLEREIHELRLLVEKQSVTIEAYSAASESSAVEEAVSAAASVEPVEVEEQVVEKKQPYRSLVNYLVDGDRITHVLKDSEWCVYYDKEAGELLGSGGIYKSLRSFVIAHRAAMNRPAKNIAPWNECKVLRNGTYIKMSEIEPV
jgi:hypothetical protein